MSELAVPMLRAAVRRIKELPASPTQFRLYGRDPEAESRAQYILGRIVNKESVPAWDFFGRAGLRDFFIVEDPRQSDAFFKLFTAAEPPPVMLGVAPLTANGTLLTFDPDASSAGVVKDINNSVHRLIWQTFLNQAFPGFAAELAHLQSTTEKSPYFREYFLDPYAHFFTRVAAMEAGCFAFAAADSVQELEEKLPALAALKGTSGGLMPAAALLYGLLFSLVLNFELFPETNELAAERAPIIRRKLMSDHILAEWQIQQVEAFARRLLQDSLMPGQDVRMDGHYHRVLTNWAQFDKAVSRG